MTRNGIRVLAAAAMVGAALTTGGTAQAAPAGQAGGDRATTAALDCVRGEMCMYKKVNYGNPWWYIATGLTRKCTWQDAISRKDLPGNIRSYANRTTRTYRFYTKNWKLVQTVKPRGQRGAFNKNFPLSKAKKVYYVCTGKR